MSDEADRAEFAEFASNINVAIGNIFDGLGVLSAQVACIWKQARTAGGRPRLRDLGCLEADAVRLLGIKSLRIHGAGVVLAPGEIADADMHIEWWCGESDHSVHPLKLDFNRRSDSFYNYLTMPWYSRVRDTGKPCVAGPFVDVNGTEEYIVAFSVPMFDGDRFIGVAAADVSLESLEPLLVRGLMRFPNEAVLLNADGRVLAANTPSWMAGDLVRPREASNYRCGVVGLNAFPVYWTVMQGQSPRNSMV
ncbi:histidine kinase [Pseudomonas alkylphenolica]|uniref:Histidine kinase n=1 Tax=Pseudomonas alkylphenolica TaxID=237609 RepID=A0A443ZUZ7_9PSED|nr:cache domain-containing protein [Pseudomonas alkylphenolica]RWU23932.1 histidine kinase [Pseudomonas alkylphenolica]